MPEQYRGLPLYYDDIMQQLWKKNFYEFKDDQASNLEPGQLCTTVINYNNDKTYQLDIQNYDKNDEFASTWCLKPLTCRLPIRDQRIQGFDLETNERIILRRAKLRFVILLSKVEDSFPNPNITNHHNYWLVLPLFSYKASKHSVDFILEDQCLNSSFRFYIPPSINIGYRLDKESAARYHLIQPIFEDDIKPILAFNDEKQMQKGFKVSLCALKLIVYHYYKNLNLLKELNTGEEPIETEYDIFKDAINNLIQKSKETST